MAADHRAGITVDMSYTLDTAFNGYQARKRTYTSHKTTERDAILWRKWVTSTIGGEPVYTLATPDVETCLELAAPHLARRSLDHVLMLIRAAITHAQSRGYVRQNVAQWVQHVPYGRAGRKSQAMTVSVASDLLTASTGWLHAYLAVSLLTGVRTEEARPLEWKNVELDTPVPHIRVATSVRHDGLKTARSYRAFKLPRYVVGALREQRVVTGNRRYVFGTKVDTIRDAANVRRSLRALCKSLGIEYPWTPRELRHTFVSLMYEKGARLDLIARLVGHATTDTTESVYLHATTPIITDGADIADQIFSTDLFDGPPKQNSDADV